MASSLGEANNRGVCKIMNKAFLLIVVAVTLLGACSGDQRDETSIAAGPLSPWHSLTEAEVQEAAAAVMDSTDDAVVFNRISLLEPDKEQAIAWQGAEPAHVMRPVRHTKLQGGGPRLAFQGDFRDARGAC